MLVFTRVLRVFLVSCLRSNIASRSLSSLQTFCGPAPRSARCEPPYSVTNLPCLGIPLFDWPSTLVIWPNFWWSYQLEPELSPHYLDSDWVSYISVAESDHLSTTRLLIKFINLQTASCSGVCFWVLKHPPTIHYTNRMNCSQNLVSVCTSKSFL